MFVCHCRAVTDREIGEAIAAGARDLDEIGRRCGAGITCGGCCPLLQELLDKATSPLTGDRPLAERTMVGTARRR
jgi:bacterioferritin-associated ferredoxin